MGATFTLIESYKQYEKLLDELLTKSDMDCKEKLAEIQLFLIRNLIFKVDSEEEFKNYKDIHTDGQFTSLLNESLKLFYDNLESMTNLECYILARKLLEIGYQNGATTFSRDLRFLK